MYQSYGAPPPQHYSSHNRHHTPQPPPSRNSYHPPPPQSGYGQPAHGGYHHHAPPPPPRAPPGADGQLWQYFSAVDKDGSGSISLMELQSALVNGNWSKFDLDTVKMLMGMFDTDRSGTIGFDEFQGLWKYVADWQNVFRHFDRDRSGSIEGRELSEALRSFGYNLSPALLTMVEQKYASEAPSAYGPPPGITFDRFVRACVTVKSLTEAFQRVDTDRDGWVQISYEQFMKIVLSAP